jgi:Family of unknown function (DUF6159)
MSGRIERGWSIAKASFAVLRDHPRLLILPAISAAALIGAFVVIFSAVLIEAGGFREAGELVKSLEQYWTDHNVVGIAALGLLGWVLTSISVYFNAALVYCVLRCFAGETPSLRAGLMAAVHRLPQIIGWAFVAVVVGGIISAIQETLKDKLGFLGSLLGGLLDFAWAATTYFVLPIVVVESAGPITAVKRSAAVLRKTWGEAVVGSAGLSVIGLLLVLPAILLAAAGIALTISSGQGAIALVFFVIAGLYIAIVSVVMATLGSIFRTGVYVFATTGQAPLDETLLRDAFGPKPPKKAGWFRR